MNSPVKSERLRVAHVITRLILGGAQENTLLTVEDQLRDYGDDVTLITGPALGPEGSLIERAEAGNVPLRIIPQLRRSVNPWRDWSSYRAIVRLLKELRPDVVHTHSSKAGILGRAASAKVGLPCVHTIHGPSFHANQGKLANALYRRAEIWGAKRCDKLISVCDAMTEQYVAAEVAPREKFVTVYSGMEVEPFLIPPRPRDDIRRELGFGPGDVVVGKIARLFELKGHDDVIEAARIAAARCSSLRFLFVGDGLLRDQLKQRIAALGLTDRFVFTGLVSPARVPELIHAMDLVVHASLREGLARVLPQALIAGKPVISYDVDGAKEVVLNNQTGILLAPRDIQGMATGILLLAGNPELRDRLGQRGRAKFTDQFRHQTMTRRLREIYREVIAKRLPK